ncbi:hypothetical protein, partial [Streptococcus dysgalactiae]|uniref:hypothetical protein n=1 Tax=Streptococcus dysgalactiae TaxID=1334 RepID=UPI00194FFB70
DQVMEGLSGVRAYQDDVIIYGKSPEEHYERLFALMERFAENNVSIKPSKCLFRVTELPFWGYVIDANGYRPDPTRYKALKKGWRPNLRKKFPILYQVRDDLSIQPDGVIRRGDRLRIPPPLRKYILDDLPKDHMGIEKVISLARQEVWWPEDRRVWPTRRRSRL